MPKDPHIGDSQLAERSRAPETVPSMRAMSGGTVPRETMPHSVVAFADALGTKVTSSSETTAATFLGRLQGATDSVAQRMSRIGSLYHIHVRWFSDSIAMSVHFDDQVHLNGLLENLAFVQAGYALNGVFLRGAVTTGPHHHSEYIDYGPALTEAVGLERARSGDPPRIVLSPRLQRDLHAFGTQQMPIVEDLEDGAYFLDFFKALDPLSRPALRSQIEACYCEAKKGGDEGVLQKLEWLASYYDWRTPPPKRLRYTLKNRNFRELH